jgi:hypothetical protein
MQSIHSWLSQEVLLSVTCMYFKVEPSANVAYIEVQTNSGGTVITFGVVLLLIGFLLGIPILWTLGMILLVVGVVLWILGSVGREVGGRRHYY